MSGSTRFAQCGNDDHDHGGMTNLPGTLHTAHDGAWQVAEHGCQVLAWQADGKPVIWFDPEHADESDAVIRGGVPLCAPWFGHGPNNDQDPQHGLARPPHPWPADDPLRLHPHTDSSAQPANRCAIQILG